MTQGTFLAFDFGERRIGVAVGNDVLKTAQPLAIVPSLPVAQRFDQIEALISEWQPTALIVGVARNADGSASAMTARCERFANQLHGRFHLPVARVDERYSSLDAEEEVRKTRSRGSRLPSGIDAVAATIILHRYFETIHDSACH